MSWRVKKSYSRYCRQPAIALGARRRSSRSASQNVVDAALRRLVGLVVSSAADSETEKNTDGRASSASRAPSTQSTIAFW